MNNLIIDLSQYQGTITDWSGIVKDCAAVIQRSTKKSGSLDPTCVNNWRSAKQYGLPVHFYKFMYALDFAGAYDEMKSTIEALRKSGVDPDRIWIDVEKWDTHGTHTAQEVRDIISGAYMACMLSGISCGLYVNYYYLTTRVSEEFKDFFDIWLARYTENDTFLNEVKSWGWRIAAWQYTSRGKMSGVSGDVDLSRMIDSTLFFE